jgi:transforming growth factor-beta-induced protein
MECIMRKSNLIVGILTVVGAATIASAQCGGSTAKSGSGEHHATLKDAHYADGKSIVQTAIDAGKFKTLVAAVKAAGLADVLSGEGNFTVFAPTDDAFAKLPAGTVETLLKPENKAKLAGILKYHVLSGQVLASQVKTGSVATLDGQRVDLKLDGAKVTIDGANVIATDILANNGVIHVIDSVILPSDLDIVQTATSAGSFTTLASLLEKAGLVDALKGDGPFTVFAPTDDAFAKLPAATVASLLRPENKEKLAAILKFHVVSGRVFSDAAAKGATVATLQGGEVTTKSTTGTVTVNGAKVIKADIDASNGVIHVIDTVILPKQ